MPLNIGRKGWLGAGLQTGFQVPATVTDYIPFDVDTLYGTVDQLPVNSAYSRREDTFTTVPGKQYGQGEVDVVFDNKFAGYLLLGALGNVTTTSLGGGVYSHYMTVRQSNTPQYLTLINDRVTDRQLFPDVMVDTLDLEVQVGLASMKCKVMSSFPQTTASGNVTTASGVIYSFVQAGFAFGTTVSGAHNATNIKPHDLKLSLNNNGEVVPRHGSANVASVNSKKLNVKVEGQVYFENTTDRDAYYAQSKQAASFYFNGPGVGGGNNANITFNLYQTSFNALTYETGLDNFYAEKFTCLSEVDNASGLSVDATVVNNKSLYI